MGRSSVIGATLQMAMQQELPSRQPPGLDYLIEEQALVAKSGNPQENEDFIHRGPSFLSVIDGVTSKTSRRWGNQTGGQVCTQIIDQILSQLPGDATAREAVDALTAGVNDFYLAHDMVELIQEDSSERITAVLVVVSLQRREVWFVGDCQAMLDDCLLQNTKLIDQITAETRAMFLETEVQNGVSIEALRRNDTGRAFILPLLKRQQVFQNNPAAGVYWHPAIDGLPVPDEGIRIEPIPEGTQTVILASDGYPLLEKSLAASEQALQHILKNDPLLFRMYKATKGMQEGHCSYDDRAYMKIKLFHTK